MQNRAAERNGKTCAAIQIHDLRPACRGQVNAQRQLPGVIGPVLIPQQRIAWVGKHAAERDFAPCASVTDVEAVVGSPGFGSWGGCLRSYCGAGQQTREC
jgi:hypothetical protein